MTKFTYASQEDVAQAFIDFVSLIRDVDEASSDRRVSHLTRFEILIAGALHRKALCKEGSLSAQLMDYIASPSGSKKKPRLRIVKG